ncbi:hypothetical protein [Pseudomonas sp. TCU-HL1]|uniref:hypothetical protein n=1 Tax=Pseudomonas sp. TCU-HL1 TaxID=1856685 RepID=UPI000855999B|nr:hypothetical protein [Pseudomonas sp. TCU-HL1]AOE87965.1 hypothetical protein THL1_5418 [Pseudomonas sp. TCU-HL1]
MNNDVMRLSDLVPEYARHYRVSPQEAAHALHELIEELYIEHGEKRGNRSSLNDIFWVGMAGFPQRSARAYSFYFELLSKYFYDSCDAPSSANNGLVNCYSRDDEQFKDIPASVIYFTRSSLNEWIIDAGITPPGFILSSNACDQPKEDKRGSELKTIELGTISKIMNGLVNLIKEVDKAHRERPADRDGKKRIESILSAASRLHSPRENFDLYSAVISLAEDAGVDMPKDHKTLRKYMRAQSNSGE